MTDTASPNASLQAQLSAFVDDQLPAAETDLFLRRLVKDAELKQTLARYQLIGEALRAPATAQLSRDFSARVAAALAPSVAPAVSPRANRTWLRRLKPVAGLTIAAGVAIMSVMAIRTQQSATFNASVADTLQPVVLTAQRGMAQSDSPESYVVPAAANTPSAPIPAARLTNYVVAHSEFSSPLGRRNVVTGLLAGEQGANEAVGDVTSEP